MTDDTDTPTDVPDFDLDRICWMLAHGIADFNYRVWIDHHELDEEFVYDDDYERGYAHGMCQQALTDAEQLAIEGINVFARARRYADAEGISIGPIWLEDVDCDDDLYVDLHDYADSEYTRSFTAIPEELREKYDRDD